MRELRFRAWDKKRKKMWYFGNPSMRGEYNELTFEWLNEDDWDSSGIIGAPCYDDMDNFELMQYTGLHDKNGKEIYEGDIVKENDELWWVLWANPPLCGFEAQSIQYGESYCLGGAGWEKAEVIGNIYEDSELLKKKVREA